MAMVTDFDAECPFCGGFSAIDDFNCRTGETSFNCPDCGFSEYFYYKRDENGNFVKKDENKGYEFDNLFLVKETINDPYAAFSVYHSNGVSENGTLANLTEYNSFIEQINAITGKDGSEIVMVTISRYDGIKINKTTIFEKLS